MMYNKEDMAIPDEFLTWLREKLEEGNLSQAEASRRAGLNPNAISDIMTGKVQQVSLRTCKRLAALFGTPPEAVLALAGHLSKTINPQDDPTFEELYKYVKQLTPEEREEILRFVIFRFQESQRRRGQSTDRANTRESKEERH